MTFKKIMDRIERHPVKDHILGLWFARHLTKHGIITVSGGLPFPKVINRGGKIFTDNVQFYSGVRLEIGEKGILRIGKGTYINRNTIIVTEQSVEIGKNCKISWDVVIMDSDLHSMPGLDIQNKPVIIEDNVWIGCRSIILKGVHVGEGAIIAAGSVVTRDVSSQTVVGGVPARVLQKLNGEREHQQ